MRHELRNAPMNARFRRHMSLLAFITCIAWHGVGLSHAAAAGEFAGRRMPENPLRPSERDPQQKAETPFPVQQAVATRPVTADKKNEAARATVRPASAFEPTRARRPVSRPASRPVSYGRSPMFGTRAMRRPTPGFMPRHMRASYPQGDSVIVDGPTEAMEPIEPMNSPDGGLYYGEGYDQLPAEGEFMDPELAGEFMDPALAGECMSPDGCGTVISDCGECGGYGCACCCGCLMLWPCLLDRIELFAGAQGFTAPLNRGGTGSFGFHYGGNWGAPVPGFINQPIGMQLGYRGVSTNYSGASFSEDSRHQSFITAGLFRRVDWGLQGGVVVDILAEEWYYDTLELTQLRGELSWVFPQWHEIGFWFSAGTKSNDVESVLWTNGQSQTVIETYEPNDLMAFFYRRRFEEIGGGYGRLFAGFSGFGEGLIGTDFNVPLTPSLALKSNFTYLIPKDGNSQIAHREEAWNLGLTLVWYPGCRKAVGTDYFRPLFDVADNGNFIVRRLADD